MKLITLLLFILLSANHHLSVACKAGKEHTEVKTDRLTILKKSCLESPALWQETHCKKTANAIVSLLLTQKIINAHSVDRNDQDKFKDSVLGKKLLTDQGQSERLLFHVNVCEGGHVFIADQTCSNPTKWRIFQSWQNEFKLSQWLGLESWSNKKFNSDFAIHGKGQEISSEQLLCFYRATS